MRFGGEAHKKYINIAKKHNRPLSTLIRELLETFCNNPSILNPVTTKTDTETIVKILELMVNESAEKEGEANRNVLTKMTEMDSKIEYLLKKQNIPKKELEKLQGKDMSGGSIFE